MKAWLKYSIATTFFVVGVGGSIAYNQLLEPYLNSESVYVATHNLSADAPIQTGAWTRERLLKSQVSPGAVTNLAELAGMYTAQPMSANQQFTVMDTESDPFTITPGTQDVPIPSSWIASVSETLRQGDYVDITPLAQSQGTTTASPTWSASTTASSPSTISPGNVSLNNILVLSVHTSNNQEVTNAAPPTGTQTIGTLYNGTGNPSNIDLKMTTAQAKLLTSYIEQKAQLFITGVASGNERGGGTQ